MRRILSCSLACVLVVSCKEKAPEAAPPQAPSAAAPVAAAPTPAADTTPRAISQPDKAGLGYVTGPASLKRERSEEKHVEDPKGKSKKKLSNWLATLNRGEEVRILATEEEWLRVKASDDTEGWIQKANVILATEARMATTAEDLKTFGRPDLLALNAQKTIPAGSLLFLTKEKDAFGQVNTSTTQSAWVMADKLLFDDTEVAAAKLIHKVRALEQKADPTTEDVRKLALSQLSGSKLIQLLERPVADAGEAPSVAPTESNPAVPAAPDAPSSPHPEH